MEENKRNLRLTRKRFIAQLRENLKNAPNTDNITHFNLAPYTAENQLVAETVRDFIYKCRDILGVLEILEERHSEHEKISEKHPEINWFKIGVHRKKFTELCHDYGIKGPDEEDEDDDDEFASLKTSTIEKAKEVTGNPVRKMEVSKDHRGYHVKVNGKFVYSTRSGVYGKRIYEIAKNGKYEIDFDLGKGVLSWFNSNSDNPIYKKGGFDKTKILEYRSDFLYPANDIKITLKE